MDLLWQFFMQKAVYQQESISAAYPKSGAS